MEKGWRIIGKRIGAILKNVPSVWKCWHHCKDTEGCNFVSWSYFKDCSLFQNDTGILKDKNYRMKGCRNKSTYIGKLVIESHSVKS